MTLARAEVVPGIQAELGEFAQLVAGLTQEQWSVPTRCAGWTTADIAGHVAGLTSDIASGRFDELAAPGAPDRQAKERRGRTPKEIATELKDALSSLGEQLGILDDASWDAPAPAGIAGTLGFGAEAIWYDAWVHGDDIRDALGQPSARGPGLRAAVSHLAGLLTEQGWGPATLELDGLEPFHIGSGGDVIRADPVAFVMVATGRAHPLDIGVKGNLNVYASV